MTHDIKATVEELDRSSRTSTAKFLLVALREWPSLLAEIRRLWFIEEAAVRYREANAEAKKRRPIAKDNWINADLESRARKALFAALPPRKPSGGEESKP